MGWDGGWGGSGRSRTTDRETGRTWGVAVGGEAKIMPGGLCPESWECPNDLSVHGGSQGYPITGIRGSFLKKSRPDA